MVILLPYAFFTFARRCDTLVVQMFADPEGKSLTGKGCQTEKMPAIGGGFDVPFLGRFLFVPERKSL